MTWRHNGRIMPDWITCTQVWSGRGTGRWYKRRLSKARRRWRDEHRRGLSHIETECNYKGW